jgi:hypothetical protein
MNTIKFQNYAHYKLPITIKPLEYGKLIEQFGNKYIIQLNTTNVIVLVEKENENFIKLFKKGELMFEYKDIKKSEYRFVRTILDQRYTFENNKLISTEILSVDGNVFIYPLYKDTNAITPLLKQNFNPLIILLIVLLIFHDIYDNEYLMLSANIIKLRKTST